MLAVIQAQNIFCYRCLSQQYGYAAKIYYT